MQEILLDSDTSKRIVLVDGGYLLFYRWHATQRWIGFQKDLEVDAVEMFASHLENQLAKMMKTLKVDRQHLIFCMDARSRSVWRHGIADDGGIEYKAGRISSVPHDAIIPVYLRILGEMGHVVQIDRLEADDIVALMLRKIPAEYPVTVITSDHDYLQLKREGLEILNATYKPVKGLSEDPEVNLWAKIFMGDPSDHIPPSVPRCGKKTALKLAQDPVLRQETIDKYERAVELNRALIDFQMIPGELVEAFEHAVKISK